MTNQPTKHTPGPWHTDIGHAVIGGQVMPLLGPDGASPEELWANSALIAAAPELLAELKGVVGGWCMGRPFTSEDAVRLAAIIARAEGGR